jgi:CO dehydrogenase/acetyl-CoA synthase gamma subunit (corrinoid Fe-S protein)
MTGEETQIPPHAIAAVSMSLEKLAAATQQQTAATLAAAIIAASGKSWSIEQALEVAHDIQCATYPAPNAGFYKEWLKTKGVRLKKVHGKS